MLSGIRNEELGVSDLPLFCQSPKRKRRGIISEAYQLVAIPLPLVSNKHENDSRLSVNFRNLFRHNYFGVFDKRNKSVKLR